jgi:Na+-translocating ferredoxin:NAD+ oxidoreductase RnfC subunit
VVVRVPDAVGGVRAERHLVLRVVRHGHPSGDEQQVSIQVVDGRGAVDLGVLVQGVGGVDHAGRAVGGGQAIALQVVQVEGICVAHGAKDAS